jgi:4-hydroxybenzoate polyprenyltransferase/phosphoserine phosphatase
MYGVDTGTDRLSLESRLTMEPLIVDLDGTLVRTDTLFESLLLLFRKAPWRLFGAMSALLRGRAVFKVYVSQFVILPADSLPYNEDLLDYLRSQRAAGRQIVLATAAHYSIAGRVSDYLGLFDHVLATQDEVNLKGNAKLTEIRKLVGANFVYAGDSSADLPIWLEATGAILVGASPAVSRQVEKTCRIEQVFARPSLSVLVWIKAIRAHQWLKNTLIFVPLLTAFSFNDVSKLIPVIAGFIAFSLAASATYIWNDLVDLESDRRHPRKCKRPMASGAISIPRAILAACALMSAGLVIAYLIYAQFLAILVAYIVLTTSYSLVFKHYVLIDVLMLAVLYTVRILAGAIALEASISAWLLAFSLLIFYSLAILKRCAELISLQQCKGKVTAGRDYRVTDLAVLWPLGIGASLSSVVVFCLFIQAADTQSSYVNPTLLWGVVLAMLYWLSRLWVKTSRAEMHDDPLVYAIKDRGCRITIAAMVAFTIGARFVLI